MIVDDPDRCNDVLSSKGYTVLERFVIAVRLQERFTNMSDFLRNLKMHVLIWTAFLHL